MQDHYVECRDCPIRSVCKYRSGELQISSYRSWCNTSYRIMEALKLSGIPKRFLNANMFNYTVSEYNKDVYTKMIDITNDILNVVDGGKNYLFLGAKPGVGKTHHASILLNHYIYRASVTNRFDFETPLAMFVPHPKLIDMLRYDDDEYALQKKMELLTSTNLLLLDDLGAGTLTAYAREQTFLIINERYENGLPTIITSNKQLKELNSSDELGQRITSRLLNDATVFTLTGLDKRVKRGG